MTMIGNIYTDAARANWATVPGRKTTMEWTGSNATKVTFWDNDTIVFVQYITYDENDNPTIVECKAQ